MIHSGTDRALAEAVFLHHPAESVIARHLPADAQLLDVTQPVRERRPEGLLSGPETRSYAYVAVPCGLTTLLDTSHQSWMGEIEARVDEVFFVAQTIGRHLRERGGGNLALIWTEAPFRAGPVPRTVQAGALTSMVKALGRDFSKDAVSINGVALPSGLEIADAPAVRATVALAVSSRIRALTGQVLRPGVVASDVTWGPW